RGLVRTVIKDAAVRGLLGEHHFFISFDTRHPGVKLSSRMRAQYAEEMTIVLQHQFWDLKVTEEGFEVGLSFNGVTERLGVPFAAVRRFADPSVNFDIRFAEVTEAAEADEPAPAKDSAPQALAAPEAESKPAAAEKTESARGEVVSLDRFRKK
ncbi:MAG: SspB family protein, partial [Xanthobacteraceae bacterium]